MNQITPRPARPAVLNGIPIIDADTHVSEWPDLWSSRAPASLKDRLPTLKMIDGVPNWVIDGDKLMGWTGAASAIRKDGTKAVGAEFITWQLDAVHRGAYDVTARLAYMDENGITAQIAYPNVLGFGGQKAMLVDGALRLATIKIYNDAMAELQAQSGGRIFPMALMPWWDVREAVSEAERCHAMGLRGINTNSDPHAHGLPDLSDKHWYPLWEACTALDLPVNFHIGASDTSMTWHGAGVWPSHNPDAQLAFGSLMMFIGNSRVITNIILSLMLERFPKLKIVSVESGVGWLPFLLEGIEYQMREAGIKYSIRPIDLFRRQIYACAWFERENFVTTARALGTGNVLFETDFPHPTCLYPDALGYMAEVAAQFTPEERRQVFGGNAAKVYNIDVK